MPRHFSDIALSLLILLLQTTVVRFLSIQGIVPDIVLLWIVYLAIRRGQITATVAGFLLGLTLDLISGPDGMVGLAALTKTLAGFLAGYFYNENKIQQTLGGYQFIIIVVLISLVHNVIYFLLFLQGSGLVWSEMLMRHGVPATVYTVAVALLPMFAFARKVLS
jgi:rod shape-determining protein MreD